MDWSLKLVLVCGLFVGIVGVPFSLGRMGAEGNQNGLKAEPQPAYSKPLGGDIPAARAIVDPHPAFVGVAVDPVNDIVVMADTNRKSVVSYDRNLNTSNSGETSDMRRQIIGPETNIGFVAGVAVDPARRELYAVNNDIEDTMMVWSYDAQGNETPARL